MPDAIGKNPVARTAAGHPTTHLGHHFLAPNGPAPGLHLVNKLVVVFPGAGDKVQHTACLAVYNLADGPVALVLPELGDVSPATLQPHLDSVCMRPEQCGSQGRTRLFGDSAWQEVHLEHSQAAELVHDAAAARLQAAATTPQIADLAAELRAA